MVKNWEDINWKNSSLVIHDLQRKIFDASAKEKGLSIKPKTREFQRKLINCDEAKRIAVRKISQDNRGKRTPGVDGISKIGPKKRLELTKQLRLDGKADPIRRVLIPKGDKTRPLGIPTMRDRAKQCLVTMALEPEWEALFDSNSYGFRPGYSQGDAKWMVTRQIQGGPKFFLDADIKGCFDNISHEYLLNKLSTMRMVERQIKSWLEAGILDTSGNSEGRIEENTVGTPQGGTLSPLLANIALDGMEKRLYEELRNKVRIIRFADDFVVFSDKLENVLASKKILAQYLKPIGLEFSKEKTRIGHTMTPYEGQKPGLDFLGFNFKNYKVSKHRGVKNTRGAKQEFLQVTKPSDKAIKKHKDAIRKILRVYKQAPMQSVMEALSSIIKGWTWYFSLSQSTETFTMLDGWIWKRLWRWAVKRHKSARKAKKECFSVKGWAFGFVDKDGHRWVLKRYDSTQVRRFVKIRKGASIYDGKLRYFAERMPMHNPRIKRLGGLLVSQEYKCAKCQFYLLPNDIVELHHVLDDNKVRTGEIKFVHGHCHDLIHGNNLHSSSVDNGQEPCELRSSRTVRE